MFTEIADLINAVHNELDPLTDMMGWAEEEISAAQHRHPAYSDTLHHSFILLHSHDERMRTEFVYRGHARELLDRVAEGANTRPATAAEITLAFCQISQAAPLNSTATGLLFRMWHRAFPDTPLPIEDDQQHREQLFGSRIDDAETEARAKLAVPTRTLGTIECRGWHHGEPVACHYAPLHLHPDHKPA